MAPIPLQTEYSLFRLSLSQSNDWDLLKPKKASLFLYFGHTIEVGGIRQLCKAWQMLFLKTKKLQFKRLISWFNLSADLKYTFIFIMFTKTNVSAVFWLWCHYKLWFLSNNDACNQCK